MIVKRKQLVFSLPQLPLLLCTDRLEPRFVASRLPLVGNTRPASLLPIYFKKAIQKYQLDPVVEV